MKSCANPCPRVARPRSTPKTRTATDATLRTRPSFSCCVCISACTTLLTPELSDQRQPPLALELGVNRDRLPLVRSSDLGGKNLITQWGNFGGFRDGHTKHKTPTAPNRMTGRRNCHPTSISTTLAVHEALPDDPLPITRECEKNTSATIHATTELQTSSNPRSRRDEMLIACDAAGTELPSGRKRTSN